MRVPLGIVMVAGLAALCTACGQQTAEADVAPAQPQGELVRAVSVCPTPGPEEGCLTVTAQGKTYDVTGSVDAASTVAVSLKGYDRGETGACGVKLSEVSVEYSGIQCGMAPDPSTIR